MNGTVKVRQSEQGFTLVELAIVMIIIGLLIGGILKGQELVSNARVSSTVAQIKGIDAAINTFRDKYAAMPGDMPNSDRRLPNCAAEPCLTGNAGGTLGNGRVDTVANFDNPPGLENTAIWAHLAAGDMISGVNYSQNSNAWGGNYPEASIGGGGYYFAHIPSINDLSGTAGDATFRAGHYLALHNSVPTAAVGTSTTSLLTPSQAFGIDNKLDDGSPISGSVLSGGNAATCVNSDDGYNQVIEDAPCNLFIRIQQ